MFDISGDQILCGSFYSTGEDGIIVGIGANCYRLLGFNPLTGRIQIFNVSVKRFIRIAVLFPNVRRMKRAPHFG
jgi:hypothetical protein